MKMRRRLCSPWQVMPSLLDKLRASQPGKKPSSAPEKPAAEGCLIREKRFPCHEFPARPLKADSLRLMTGRESLSDIDPSSLLFLDTETTGLNGGAGTVAFLIGLGQFSGDEFVVTQYLMRDYDEEPFVLAPVLDALSRCEAVVTFNGASFDMPLIQSRLTMNRMHGAYEAPDNIDLVHIARRVFKMRVRPCKLTQLESEIFNTPREDDLPGSEVPARYFTYIKTREAALLEDIIEHNAQDIVSMARLMYALVNLHERPLEAADQRDLYSLGRVFEKRGEGERAKACFRLCRDSGVRDLAQLRLSEILRREGNAREAAEGYERLRLSGRGGAKVYIALAKLYEHRFRDPARALAIARQGMIYCLEALDGGGAQSREYQDLAYRSRRLIEKNGGHKHGLDGQLQNTSGAFQASEGRHTGGEAGV